MSTESPFFTEDFIRRYREIYPPSDDCFRAKIYEYLESPEPMTFEKLRFIAKFSYQPLAAYSAYTVDSYRVQQAFEAGSAELGALRAEIEEKLKQIKRLEKAQELDRELQNMLLDPRITE